MDNADQAKKGGESKTGRRAGQIINRGPNRYLCRVPLGRDASGTRRYHSATITGTKKDAQRYIAERLRELDLGTFHEPSKMLLGDYLDKWMREGVGLSVEESTLRFYAYIVKQYIKPALGGVQLRAIKPLDVQAFINAMTAERGLSPKTVRHVYVTLRGALRQAVQWRLLHQNPAEAVKLPKLDQARAAGDGEREEEGQEGQTGILTPEQVAIFVEAARGDRYGLMFILAIMTGMRPGEYMGLKWRDLDFEKGTVTVKRSKLIKPTSDGQWFKAPKTKGSHRTIPLPPALLAELRTHRRGQAEERLRAANEWEAHGLIFCTETGRPVDLQNATKRHFKPILLRAGLPNIRLYDLRHVCASLLLKEKVSPKVVQERLGHKSITLTLQTYSHLLPGMQEEATSILENVCFGKFGTQ